MITFLIGVVVGLVIGGFLGFSYLAYKVTSGLFGG
jgi:hypothetical protein